MASVDLFMAIIVEFRPRLRSVNVFVTLKSPIGRDDKLDVSLDTQTIIIKMKNQMFNIDIPNVIITNSLSYLTIVENYVSFRFNTDTPGGNMGGFKTELLTDLPSQNHSCNVKSFLLANKKYKIQCVNCAQNLNESLHFVRVLPLPSDCSDPGEWFCHAHDQKGNHNDLSPKIGDIFFSHCYFHIHIDNIKNVLKKLNLVICKRCLSWLGVYKKAEYGRFWFNTVKFIVDDEVYYSSPLIDVFTIVQNVMRNSLLPTVKIILDTQCSQNKFNYLLIWVLESGLNIMFGDSPGDMEEFNVAKVLYKFENDVTNTVDIWQNDSSVNSITISKTMMLAILRDLHKYNKMLPKNYNESNSFYISYLMFNK